jgi:hypothetical protein
MDYKLHRIGTISPKRAIPAASAPFAGLFGTFRKITANSPTYKVSKSTDITYPNMYQIDRPRVKENLVFCRYFGSVG